MTAFRIEAERQSVSVDELLSQLRAALDFGDVNVSDVNVSDVIASVSDVIDLARMDTGLLPCVADAMQRAGVSFQSEVESLMDRFGRRPR